MSNFLLEILRNETSSDCMCGLCQGELGNKILRMNIKSSDINRLCIANLKRKDQKIILKKTIESLKKIKKSSFFNIPEAGQDLFFSSEGIFIRKLVMMLDYYFERRELHKLLKNCLARAYLLRMENHYQRANAHYWR